MRHLKIAAALACLFLSQCAEQEPARKDFHEAQLRELERIARLERDVQSFAATQPGVSKADVYIRPGAAIVLLTPSGRGEIGQATLEGINARIKEGAGLREDQITIGAHGPAGRGE